MFANVRLRWIWIACLLSALATLSIDATDTPRAKRAVRATTKSVATPAKTAVTATKCPDDGVSVQTEGLTSEEFLQRYDACSVTVKLMFWSALDWSQANPLLPEAIRRPGLRAFQFSSGFVLSGGSGRFGVQPKEPSFVVVTPYALADSLADEVARSEELVKAGLFQPGQYRLITGRVFRLTNGVSLGLLAKTIRRESAAGEAGIRADLKKSPDDPELLFNLGNAFYDQGRRQEAQTLFEKAIEKQPDFVKALINLGVVLQESGKAEEALTYFDRALVISRTDAAILCHKGQALCALGRRQAAMGLFLESIALYPKNQLPHYLLGVALADSGDYREAIAEWEKVVATDANSEVGKVAAEGVKVLRSLIPQESLKEERTRTQVSPAPSPPTTTPPTSGLEADRVLASAHTPAELESLFVAHPNLGDYIVPKIEEEIVRAIETDGLRQRFWIKDIAPRAGAQTGRLTLQADEGASGVVIAMEFSSDGIPFNIGMGGEGPSPPMGPGSIHRFSGTVTLGEYSFVGEGDKYHRLTFALIEGVGYVYLRGKGRVVSGASPSRGGPGHVYRLALAVSAVSSFVPV